MRTAPDAAGVVGLPWRLLLDGAASGAWNMALDEALLERYACSSSPLAPTLRLYGWDPPALSLGRGQKLGGGPDLPFMQGEGIELVRRPTGGRAVLHSRERTYAVVGMCGIPPFPHGIPETYALIAEALRRALASLGLEVRIARGRPALPALRPSPTAACFDVTSASEITAGGRKLVGSAQLRRRSAFLQHGSILIGPDDRLARSLGSRVRAERVTDLRRCLGREPAIAEIDRAMVRSFEARFASELRRGRPTDGEWLTATRLRAWKYLSAAWTLRGPGAPRSDRVPRGERPGGGSTQPDDTRAASVEA